MEILKTIKLKVLMSLLSIALAAIAGWNIVESQNKLELSDLTLANVEALANWENEELDGPRSWYVFKDWEGNFGNVGIVKKCSKGGDQFCI